MHQIAPVLSSNSESTQRSETKRRISFFFFSHRIFRRPRWIFLDGIVKQVISSLLRPRYVFVLYVSSPRVHGVSSLSVILITEESRIQRRIFVGLYRKLIPQRKSSTNFLSSRHTPPLLRPNVPHDRCPSAFWFFLVAGFYIHPPQHLGITCGNLLAYFLVPKVFLSKRHGPLLFASFVQRRLFFVLSSLSLLYFKSSRDLTQPTKNKTN